jgi:hypothetical protein
VRRNPWLDLVLVAATFLVFGFLARHHAFVPMWLEGVAEYSRTLLTILGYVQTTPICWTDLAGTPLPLAMSAYIGPAFFYVYLPSVALFWKGVVADPYVYRYTGILLFIADAWLLYFVLRRSYSQRHAATGFLLFVSTPTLLLLALTDYQSLFVMLFPLLLAALLLISHLQTGSRAALVWGAFAAGTVLLTRVEALVWTAVPVALYLFLARRRPEAGPVQRPRSAWTVVIAAAAFTLGAAPLLVYNLTCKEDNLLRFLRLRVLPTSVTAPDVSVAANARDRLSHFVSHNLLTLWPRFEVVVPNVVFCAAALLAAMVLLHRWVRHRVPSFPLLAVATTLPLSLFVKRYLRQEHISILEPVLIVAIVSALAWLEARRPHARLWTITAAVLVASNATVSALDFRHWLAQPSTSQTMLNAADPELLARHLAKHHASDRVFYTNVGMLQAVEFMSAARAPGEEILAWDGQEAFRARVSRVLLDKRSRRVFVAVALPRDGALGTFPRTRVLREMLREEGVPFTVTRIASARNRYLYELIVVEPGAGTELALDGPPTIELTRVAELRESSGPAGPHFVGAVLGKGFRRGDAVFVDDSRTYPATFGHEGWMTFTIPAGDLRDVTSGRLRVVRFSTSEHSAALPFTVESSAAPP